MIDVSICLQSTMRYTKPMRGLENGYFQKIVENNLTFDIQRVGFSDYIKISTLFSTPYLDRLNFSILAYFFLSKSNALFSSKQTGRGKKLPSKLKSIYFFLNHTMSLYVIKFSILAKVLDIHLISPIILTFLLQKQLH